MRHSYWRVLGMAVALVTPFAAKAQTQAPSRATVFAGAEFGEDRLAYLGAVWALGDPSARGNWAVRGIGSSSRYDYSSSGREIEGETDQAELVLLRQTSGAWGYLNLGGGVRFARTDLDPADPGNDREGDHIDAVLTIDGIRAVGPWQAGGYAAYGVRMRDYYVRAEATRRLGFGPLRAGVELLAEGDDSYERTGAGVVLAVAAGGGLTLRTAVGLKRSDDNDDVYGSVGVSRSF